MYGRSIRLLVVESNPADAYLTVEALKQAGLTDGITVIDDGRKAVEHLHAARALPDVILLDLNLPLVSGLEVLAEIRSSPKLEHIPVVVVSGSQNTEDVRKAYQLKANCYITKPSSLDQFLRFVKTCYEFWGTVVTLPPVSVGDRDSDGRPPLRQSPAGNVK